jgi:hypothetical protein
MDKSKTKGLCRLIAKLTDAANRSVKKNDSKTVKRNPSKAVFKLPLTVNTFEPRFHNQRFED